MGFQSLEEIANKAKTEKKPFWEIMLKDDMSERMVTREESFEKMRHMYHMMKTADEHYDEKASSASGLVGQDGARMEQYVQDGQSLCGDFVGQVMTRAIKMGESNACMKRIVAAPTAGSCGVIPAVFITYQQTRRESEEKMVEALYVAAGIGMVIAEQAFIAGAAGGCQAEIGSASAMAAGGLAYLMGGREDEILNAVAMALKNLLGLVCDPVAGLVEVPCVKRNVIGAVNAITSADMAMAGLVSRIPADQVIEAMRSVGITMPGALKETGEGGLAATRKGVEIAEGLRERQSIHRERY